MLRFPFSRSIKTFIRSRLVRDTFSPFRAEMYAAEYDEWVKYYLPISLKGKTVLDVGAGEGETAKFFLEHGAKKVICIEPDTQCFKVLQANAKKWPIECHNKKFDTTDLKHKFDFMKMDIEGYEEELLDVEVNKPCVLEVHGLQLKDKFENAGYTTTHGSQKIARGICYAYKNITNLDRQK